MSQDIPLVESYRAGNQNFSVLFSRWMDGNEWSHPIVVSLAKGVCGGASWLHSSQISGIRQGKSQSPGPRQFVAIERLNRALYTYVHEKTLIPGSSSSNNYKEARPIVLDNGECPDLGWFVSVFCGLEELPASFTSPETSFTTRSAESFTKKYAKLVRQLMVQKELDLIYDLDHCLYQSYPARDEARLLRIRTVLTSKEVWTPEELSKELTALASFTAALGGPSSESELLSALS